MAHLKKSVAGHLLKAGTGHLVNDCPDNTCNSCSPPIPDTLYVTFSGLGGTFAAWNGKHAVPWSGHCSWQDREIGYDVSVNYNTAHCPGKWRVWLSPALPGCQIVWCGTVALCDPTGTYSFSTCADYGCGDTGSCSKCSSPTAVVSYS